MENVSIHATPVPVFPRRAGSYFGQSAKVIFARGLKTSIGAAVVSLFWRNMQSLFWRMQG